MTPQWMRFSKTRLWSMLLMLDLLLLASPFPVCTCLCPSLIKCCSKIKRSHFLSVTPATQALGYVPLLQLWLHDECLFLWPAVKAGTQAERDGWSGYLSLTGMELHGSSFTRHCECFQARLEWSFTTPTHPPTHCWIVWAWQKTLNLVSILLFIIRRPSQ